VPPSDADELCIARSNDMISLHVAAMRPEWETAYYTTILVLNTTMRGCELSVLRWRNIDMMGRSLKIQQSKTRKGIRNIPLNADAMEMIRALYHRAQQIGSGAPDHYLLFACEHGRPDPTKPQKPWRTAWRSLRKAAGLPKLRFHDLCHHAITELAESQASDQTIRDIAGHVSNRMLEHSSDIRMDAKRTAVDALASKRPAPAYDTNQDTKQSSKSEQAQQEIEKMVGSAGLEPAASSL
jgi:integrase